ncbi:MAG: hypothetical protein M5U12_05915 [Verrucomicrobia bacterium]|nr:hypothetical protein [Verrucomicrobiota bacterium]
MEIEGAGELQRQVVPDLRRDAVPEAVHEHVLGDAVRVAGARDPRLRVGQLDLGAQDVEARHGARPKPALAVRQLPLEQLDGGQADRDLLLGEQGVVEGHPHLGRGVGQHSLVPGQGLFP